MAHVRDNIGDIASKPYVELMSYPAYIDTYLMESSTYHMQRLEELDFLVSDETKEVIREHSVELIHYGQLNT